MRKIRSCGNVLRNAELVEGCELHGMARHDLCARPIQPQGGVVLKPSRGRREFFHRKSPVPDRQIFWPNTIFPPLWAAGKNPTQSYCQSTVRFVPNAKGMRTTAVSDGPDGFEHRRFECLKCTVTEIRTLASDPLRSDALRWLSSELRRPD